MVINVRDNDKKEFTNGAGWLEVMDLKAGEEVEIIVEFNWTRKGVTKDWSLTAWGEDGDLNVRHSNDIDSNQFAYTEKERVELGDEWEYIPTGLAAPTNNEFNSNTWFNPDLYNSSNIKTKSETVKPVVKTKPT